MLDIALTTKIVNGVALGTFLILLGAILFSIIRRVRLYHEARMALPSLLRGMLVLFGSLAIIGGETAFLRVLGVSLPENSLERLVFITQTNIVFLGALAYYAKIELFDLNDPNKE